VNVCPIVGQLPAELKGSIMEWSVINTDTGCIGDLVGESLDYWVVEYGRETQRWLKTDCVCEKTQKEDFDWAISTQY
jgi:hypothetical protein